MGSTYQNFHLGLDLCGFNTLNSVSISATRSLRNLLLSFSHNSLTRFLENIIGNRSVKFTTRVTYTNTDMITTTTFFHQCLYVVRFSSCKPHLLSYLGIRISKKIPLICLAFLVPLLRVSQINCSLQLFTIFSISNITNRTYLFHCW